MRIKKCLIFWGFLLALIPLSTMRSGVNSEDLNILVEKDAGLIIFSYDRPFQLYGLLESIDRHVRGLGSIFIIYRTSSSAYERAYGECFKYFSHLSLVLKKQYSNASFHALTFSAIRACPHDYILFAVDDIIVTDDIDLNDCVSYLKKTGAYGFYLRLGENIIESYSMKASNPVPQHQDLDDKVISWQFKDGIIEWCYPNTLDMTLYSKITLMDIGRFQFSSPNRLEAYWASIYERENKNTNKIGLCYKRSKIINVPFNLVQTDWTTARNMGNSKEKFLDFFNAGKRINTSRYFGYCGTAPHVELPLYLT